MNFKKPMRLKFLSFAIFCSLILVFSFQNCGEVSLSRAMHVDSIETPSVQEPASPPSTTVAGEASPSNIRVTTLTVSESAPRTASFLEFTNANVGDQVFFFSDADCSRQAAKKTIQANENLSALQSVLNYDFSPFTQAEKEAFVQTRGPISDADLLDPPNVNLGQRFSLYTYKTTADGQTTKCERVYSITQLQNNGFNCASYASQTQSEAQAISRNCPMNSRLNSITDFVTPANSFFPNPYVCGMQGEHVNYLAHSVRVQKSIPRIFKIRFQKSKTVMIQTDDMWANSLINIHHSIPSLYPQALLIVRASMGLEPCDPSMTATLFRNTTESVNLASLQRLFPGDSRLQGETITVYVTLNATYETSVRSRTPLPAQYNCDQLFCATDIQIY